MKRNPHENTTKQEICSTDTQEEWRTTLPSSAWSLVDFIVYGSPQGLGVSLVMIQATSGASACTPVGGSDVAEVKNPTESTACSHQLCVTAAVCNSRGSHVSAVRLPVGQEERGGAAGAMRRWWDVWLCAVIRAQVPSLQTSKLKHLSASFKHQLVSVKAGSPGSFINVRDSIFHHLLSLEPQKITAIEADSHHISLKFLFFCL